MTLAAFSPALTEEAATATAGWQLRTGCGHAIDLDVAAWSAPCGPADESVLARCLAPTLDIGCGPARFVTALAHRGVPSLGIDVAPEAVRQGLSMGATVLLRSIFDRVPSAGRWATALLMDGNVGIGGDPAALLGRIAEVLRPRGELLVEVSEAGTGLVRTSAVLHGPAGACGAPFPWALADERAITALADGAGLDPAASWTSHGRRFLSVVRR